MKRRKKIPLFGRVLSLVHGRYSAPRVLALCLAFTALNACTDRAPLAPTSNPLDTLVIVSAPSIQSRRLSSVRGAGPLSTATSAAADAGTLVYVSLPPHSALGGSTATIRNSRTGISISVSMMDGGFDPTPIAAIIDDDLTIIIRNRDSAVLFSANVKVRPHRPPTVVRSDPPTGKTDVPLNARIEVVFSEPIDPATIPGSVELFQETATVGGTAGLDPSGLVATFEPVSSLAPNTDYTVVITTSLPSVSSNTVAWVA